MFNFISFQEGDNGELRCFQLEFFCECVCLRENTLYINDIGYQNAEIGTHLKKQHLRHCYQQVLDLDI